MTRANASAGLGWGAIVRLGLVQSAIGATVALTTTTLNRVMVVEYGLAASLPAGLVAWHYAVQLSRARWGHGSDGGARTPWIIAGMAVLAAGALLAAYATTRMATPLTGSIIAVVAFSLIGIGVGAAGTSLLALLAARVAPARRPAAAALTWVMMIAGIVVSTGIAGKLLDPFSPQRLLVVAGGVALSAFVVALAGVAGVERRASDLPAGPKPAFAAALRELWADPKLQRFTLFVFVSMFAYSAQELILEPFAGLLFGYTLGQSTSLASLQHGGVLIGMVTAGIAGSAFSGHGGWMRSWTVAGCAGSALALAALACAAVAGPAWPLQPTVFGLGLANGVFAVAAIGSMMGLAGTGGPGSEGVRMGVWGASQAIAFAAGGLTGAVGVDVGRRLLSSTGHAYFVIFAAEATVFVAAAAIAARIGPANRTALQPSFVTG